MLVDTVSPGATSGLMACMYIGNEWNYLGTRGTTDKDEYKSLLNKLFDDITTDANTGTSSIFNVQERPLFITTQTGDVYTRDSTNLSIGTAHIELSNERDNVVCAGPHYHVPSKPGGHRDPNGSRWMGQKLVKSFITVSIEGLIGSQCKRSRQHIRVRRFLSIIS